MSNGNNVSQFSNVSPYEVTSISLFSPMPWILPTMKIEETLLAGWFVVLAIMAHVQPDGVILIAGTWFTYAIITLTGYHVFEYMAKLWLKFLHYSRYPLKKY